MILKPTDKKRLMNPVDSVDFRWTLGGQETPMRRPLRPQRPPCPPLHIVFIFLIALSLSACSSFAPAPRQDLKGNVPRYYAVYPSESGAESGAESESKSATGPKSGSGKGRLDQWWEAFNDGELNALVQTALSENFRLKEAFARFRQAAAMSVRTGSALYPDLFFEGNASRKQQRIKNDTYTSTGTSGSYALSMISSYELDLWGRVRSEVNQALLDQQATREDMRTAAMTLSASVTEKWVSILSQRMQKKLIRQQMETALTFLELIELRFQKGMVSALDVYQQRQIVQQLRGRIPLIERSEQLITNELALLSGLASGRMILIHREILPALSNLPSMGIPADLLGSRPDVRAAWLRVQSGDWQVSAAKAARLPAIRLRANAGYGPSRGSLLFDNWLMNLAANLTAPLFDAGSRRAEVARTHALVDERVTAYRRTVYTAIKEVEDALTSETRRREHLKELAGELNTARKALNEARERYRKGLSDYLPVLTQLITVQGLEQNMIQRRTELLLDRVSLYRALGGRWMNNIFSDGIFSDGFN